MNIAGVLEALQKGSKKAENPSSLVFSEGRGQEKWQNIMEKGYYRDIFKEIYQERERYLQQPITELPFSLYKIYDRTGSRKEYEREYFDRRGRLNTFAILALLDNRDIYLEGLEDIIWAICNEYSWCLPAHLGGSSNDVIPEMEIIDNTGRVKSGQNLHREMVDLFAAETAFALAEVTGLLEDVLSPLVCYRARQEILERIFVPYTELNKVFHWEVSQMNWAAVCSGSIGAAALYLIEEDEVLAPIIARVLDTMESFLSGFGDDGGCKEGLSYWNYGFGFFVYFAELLKQRTAGKIDLMDDKKVRKIALFQQKCYIYQNKIISFSDVPGEVNFHAGLSQRLADLYSEVELPDKRYRAGFSDDKCYRWAHNIRDLVWSDGNKGDKEERETGFTVDYLKDSQWLICKLLKDEGNIVFAARGGDNDEPHNHNDLGSYILHAGDTTLLDDLGSGEYTRQYFGPERYSYLCNGSQGHSLPIIEGEFQQNGSKYSAQVLKVKESPENVEFMLELAGAYNNQNLQSWIRDFRFTVSGEVRLDIEDKYLFRDKPGALIERFISRIKPRQLSEDNLRIEGNNSYLDLIYDGEQLDYNYSIEKHINHDGIEEDVFLIDLKVKNPEESGEIKISMIPVIKQIS